jgi:hypothetical protein
LTESCVNESIILAQEIINIKERTRNLLERYTMPYSLLGKCLRKAQIEGHDYSIHYLNLLEQHDNIASHIKFSDVRSIFEIGGDLELTYICCLKTIIISKKFYILIFPLIFMSGHNILRRFMALQFLTTEL